MFAYQIDSARGTEDPRIRAECPYEFIF
jgi:hypothetical protein